MDGFNNSEAERLNCYIFVIDTPLPCPFPFSSFVYAVNFADFTLILAAELIPMNAFVRTLVRFLDLMVITVSLEQL